MGKGDAKGFVVEAGIRVRYRIVAEDAETAVERVREYFSADITELTKEAYDRENYTVMETITDDVREFAEDAGEAEVFDEIEGDD